MDDLVNELLDMTRVTRGAGISLRDLQSSGMADVVLAILIDAGQFASFESVEAELSDMPPEVTPPHHDP